MQESHSAKVLQSCFPDPFSLQSKQLQPDYVSSCYLVKFGNFKSEGRPQVFTVAARSLLCFRAVSQLGTSQSELVQISVFLKG